MKVISMTDFVDFVLRTGQTKLTKVRQIKTRDDYSPAFDFWRPLREAIISMHQQGAGRGQLDQVVPTLTDGKKLARYPSTIAGYKKFMGRKTMDWFEPPREEWSSGGLTVNVNPELGLVLKGRRHVVKLYFKDRKLQKREVDVLLLMMDQVLTPVSEPGDIFAILDVENGKLFTSTNANTGLMPVLHGEAVSFMTIWSQI